MAATGNYAFPPSNVSSLRRRDMTTFTSKYAYNQISHSTQRLAISTSAMNNSYDTGSGRVVKKHIRAGESERRPYAEREHSEPEESRSLKNYFEQSAELIRSDGGPPRWFSPLECGSRWNNSPLLLFLPGLDGVGLGLITHHQKLGQIFDVWCLHIPVMDRTSFAGLLKLVDTTVQEENHHSPNRPIYLVGDTIGSCLALAVAASNPNIDLVLILANPATCFSRSQLQTLLLEVIPDSFHISLPHVLNLIAGDSLRTVIGSLEKGLPLDRTIGTLYQDLISIPSYISVLADILPRETLIWKLQMLRSSSSYANSHLHAVKSETLILCSGGDELFPSIEESERLKHILLKCEIRRFNNCSHFLFLERGVDLVTVIKSVNFYRRSQHLDYVSDYIRLTPNEFWNLNDQYKLLRLAINPVMLSTLENGEIVKGLAGIPSEGPVLLVGYHMLMGVELFPLMAEALIQRNIHLRGIAHPLNFRRFSTEGIIPDSSFSETFRMIGCVPVSGSNFYKLLSTNSHVVLYPGGMREALHRKGEEYKLFWPEQAEFVRMAARFGAKIIPFGVVGEDDFGEIIFDYDDQMKIPFLKNLIREIAEETVRLRSDMNGEVANQDLHLPGILPKLPGRYYYYFGKPLETKGRKEREKARELYIQVKMEVERCLQYLKDKRETDPYRYLLPRLLYRAKHGIHSEIPIFDL